MHKNCIHDGAKPSTIIFSWPQIDVCRAQRIRIAFIIGGRVPLEIKAGRDSILVCVDQFYMMSSLWGNVMVSPAIFFFFVISLHTTAINFLEFDSIFRKALNVTFHFKLKYLNSITVSFLSTALSSFRHPFKYWHLKLRCYNQWLRRTYCTYLDYTYNCIFLFILTCMLLYSLLLENHI